VSLGSFQRQPSGLSQTSTLNGGLPLPRVEARGIKTLETPAGMLHSRADAVPAPCAAASCLLALSAHRIRATARRAVACKKTTTIAKS
jgi:hypothetical protein